MKCRKCDREVDEERAAKRRAFCSRECSLAFRFAESATIQGKREFLLKLKDRDLKKLVLGGQIDLQDLPEIEAEVDQRAA